MAVFYFNVSIKLMFLVVLSPTPCYGNYRLAQKPANKNAREFMENPSGK